jgi:hypothetical protein
MAVPGLRYESPAVAMKIDGEKPRDVQISRSLRYAIQLIQVTKTFSYQSISTSMCVYANVGCTNLHLPSSCMTFADSLLICKDNNLDSVPCITH